MAAHGTAIRRQTGGARANSVNEGQGIRAAPFPEEKRYVTQAVGALQGQSWTPTVRRYARAWTTVARWATCDRITWGTSPRPWTSRPMHSSGSGTSRACRRPQPRGDALSPGHVPSLDRGADRVSWAILSGLGARRCGIVPLKNLLARGMRDRVRTRLTVGVED